MPSDSDNEEPAAGAENSPKVGYRKPPVAHRFKKGVSGNPAGRPPKGYSLVNPLPLVIEDPIVTAARRLITVVENGERITMPATEALARALLASAAKGNQRALLHVMRKVEQDDKRTSDNAIKFLEVMIQYKRVKTEECKRAKKKFLPWTPPVPHPDDIVIKLETAEVIFNGPKDESEEAVWTKMFQARDLALKNIEQLVQERERVGDDPEDSVTSIVKMGEEQDLADFVTSWLPDETTRRAPGFNIHVWRMNQPRYRKNVRMLKTNEKVVSRRRRKLEVYPKPIFSQ